MKKNFVINNKEFSFLFEENVRIGMEEVNDCNGVTLYRISFDWEELCSPKQITLSYSIPCVETYIIWDPLQKLRTIPFGDKQITDSRLASGMPLKGALSKDGRNTCLIALSDVKTPISERIKVGKTYEGFLDIFIDFFTMLTGPFKHYETFLRIDSRRIRFEDAVYEARDWFESLGYKNSHVPEASKYPMYSTWYSYKQDITDEDVIKECERAAALGMKAVIIDDGWQTDDTSTIYGYCGDWKPISHKFHDMKALTDKIHSLGMKVMLWFSVPFIGKYSENYASFEGMYLCYFENTECSALDPRYKRVREFLTSIYAKAVREWGLDGLKLDFIDRFKANGELSDGMDFVSVEDAVQQLLKDVYTELTDIDPEILIEFRQPYYGPVVNTYGNMMRVWDCPLDGATNRNQTINLRLVSGSCAVHADMMYWHREDTPESVALQLWGTVFSVPQISVRLNEITDEHEKVLRNYLTFWTEHRNTLTKGKLRVGYSENGYGYAETAYGEERIAMLSSTSLFEVRSDVSKSYLINLTDTDGIVLKNPDGAELACTGYDCRGNVTDSFISCDRLSEIRVPLGGLVKIGLLK